MGDSRGSEIEFIVSPLPLHTHIHTHLTIGNFQYYIALIYIDLVCIDIYQKYGEIFIILNISDDINFFKLKLM